MKPRPLIGWLIAAHATLACGRVKEEPAAPPTPDAASTVPDAPLRAPTVVAKVRSSCRLDPARNLICWGEHASGMLKPPEPRFNDISLGTVDACGIRADSSVRCWGSEVKILPSPAARLSSVSVGSWRACGLDFEGHVICWGDPADGATKAPPGAYKAISAGNGHFCALRKQDGHPVCWGRNDNKKATPPEVELTSVSAGGELTCGLDTDGRAVCWGVPITVPAEPLRAVLTGTFDVCFIHQDKHVSCATGVGVGGDRPATHVPSGPFEQIALGDAHGCGLRPDGKVECWGNNASGQAVPPP